MEFETSVDYNRTKELKNLDDTKAGVKGLVDAGITNIEVPTIDLSNIQDGSRRKEIVDEVRIATEEWGFFKVINYGIPLSVLDEMIDGVRMFNEQDLEFKKEVYNRDAAKEVRFNSNFDLYTSQTADWRDTLSLSFLDSDPDPNEMPAVGSIVCHYYPACPRPELTLGVRKHADPGILTLLLQNEISGLQVLHEGQWFDVHPIRGGLVVNIGDLLKIISNDKLKSVKHRVTANHVGPRISVPCFVSGHASLLDKPFSPIKELTSEANPPRYKELVLREHIARFLSSSLDKKPLIDYYKL
ncbi:hypothetical protein CRYUN_Cryun36dG0071700 [Craigia yunnanensis]